MRVFVSRLAVFGLLFVGFASLLDVTLTSGLRRSKHQPLSTWNQIYGRKIEADLVVSGSSRAYVHVSPAVLEQVTGLRSFNLGLNGYHFPMQETRLREYLAYNRLPRVVVQTLETTTFHSRQDLFQYEQFLPHFDRKNLVKAISGYGGYDPLDRLLPMYRYRGRTDLVLAGLGLWLKPHPDYDTDRGYRANDWSWDGTFDQFKASNRRGYKVSVEPRVVEMLDAVVADLGQAGIQPVLVFPPEFVEAQKLCINRSEVMGHFKRIASKNAIPFLDYSRHPIARDRKLFYNSQHLNRPGAERFSRALAAELAQLLETERPSLRDSK